MPNAWLPMNFFIILSPCTNVWILGSDGVSRTIFLSLGLEGSRSGLGLGLEGYISWSQPIVLSLWISQRIGLGNLFKYLWAVH